MERKVVRRLKDIKRCWLKQGDEYYFHDVEKNLPCLVEKYKAVLEQLKVPYFQYEVVMKKDHIVYCQYHNPNFYEEKEEELPVYEFSRKDASYHYLGNHKGLIPTEKAIEAALETRKIVSEETERFIKNKQLPIIQKIMEGKIASYFETNVATRQFRTAIKEGKFDNYLVFTVKNQNGNDTGELVIFDLDKIDSSNTDCVAIEFPEMLDYKLKRILGQQNECAQRWSEEIGRPISIEYYE